MTVTAIAILEEHAIGIIVALVIFTLFVCILCVSCALTIKFCREKSEFSAQQVIEINSRLAILAKKEERKLAKRQRQEAKARRRAEKQTFKADQLAHALTADGK